MTTSRPERATCASWPTRPPRPTSIIFQTGASGRAEVGLAGSDDLRVKVSADGSTWKDALVVNKSTGGVTMPNTTGILIAENTAGTSMAHNTYVDQTFTSTPRNDFGGGAWNGTTFTAPQTGIYDLSALLACDGNPSVTSMSFNKNGSAQLGFSEVVGAAGQNTILSRVVASLAAGDTIATRMRHSAGSTQPGTAGASFSIIRLA